MKRILTTAPDSPAYLQPQPENFPPELAELNQWVCWCLEWRDGESKPTKPPIRPGGRYASSSKPETWVSLKSALEGYQRNRIMLRGVGFVNTKGDPFSVVDLDDCRDAETGELADWAIDIAHELDTYTEISPSGTGLRMIARGKIPVLLGKTGGKSHGGGRAPDKKLEIYCDRRYVTVTGHTIEGFSNTIRDAQDELDTVYRREIQQKASPKPSQPKTNGHATDDDILRIVQKAKNAAKFQRLWSGDTSGYASPSEADLALCDMLAFYTGHDDARLDRLFRQSGLYRDKWDRDDYRTETINKALSGRTEFFEWKAPQSRKRTRRALRYDRTHENGETATDDRDDPLSPLNEEGQTDLANARRFRNLYGERCRYCHAWRKWLVWDGKRWEPDNTGAVVRIAKAIADKVWNAVLAFGDAASLKFAARTASERGIGSMLALAQSELPVLPTDLDQNAWLLNCENGTIDLRTGELREHRREDYITKLCPTPYNPDAESYVWDRFLEDVFEDDGVIRFSQRLFGYGATGDVREHILPIFWGSGSNGKSTLLEAITGTLGVDYTGAAPKDLLMVKRGDSHPTEIADLHGKRLIVAQETDANRTLAESLVKSLTGGDTIKARRMREDFWQFAPTHKLILCTNHKPKVRGTDHAIWRRLRLVPFTVRFEGERKDKTMLQKLTDERPGILAWIVQGCRDWLQHGLTEPQRVMAATEAYRSDSDTIGMFITECCVTSPDVRVRSSLFAKALEQWCEEAGHDAPGSKKAGSYLSERYERKQSNGVWYHGLGLRVDPQ